MRVLVIFVFAWAAHAGVYNDSIRRILSDNCFKCHGPDEHERKGKLRLDEADKQDWAEVMARIRSADPDERMPPPEANKTVTPDEIAALESWIEDGAVYETHWSFVPPVADSAGSIDGFIEAQLGELKPNPRADPYTLVRRLHLDLIGLPPSLQVADAFAVNPSPAAYEALVDQLLRSPQYGERWARRWLDLARYADTNGYEKDRARSIWPYRDWVIRALNADMPFDQFTIEQIAGDLLPNASREQLVATGFHRNTMLNEEGGIDPLEFRYHAMTDRVATTGTTWLGLTTGCAQCHTHKYDPITHHEYFGMMAFLNNADEPELDLPTPEQQTLRAERLAEADRLLAALPNQWPAGDYDWRLVRPQASAKTSKHETLEDGSILFPGLGPETDTYTFTFESDKPASALRLEALTHTRLPKTGPGRVAHGNYVLTEIEILHNGKRIDIASATADIEQKGFPIVDAFDGKPKTGWAADMRAKAPTRDRKATFTFANSASPGRYTVTIRQEHGNKHLLGRIRLSLGAPAGTVNVQALYADWRQKATTWTVLRPDKMQTNLPHLELQEDGSIFASGDTTKQDFYRLEFPVNGRRITALRLEALPDERLPAHGPGTTYYEGRKGEFFLGEFQLEVGGKSVGFKGATETYAKNQFGENPVSAALATDGDMQTGWSCARRYGERHVAVFPLAAPIEGAASISVTMHFGRHFATSLGRFRISATDALDAEADLLPADEAKMFEAFLMQAPELAKFATRVRELRKRPNYTTTLVMRERPAANPRPTHLHHRGEFTQPREQVQPHLPEVLHAFPQDVPKDRLGFAKWLVSRDNPLTARVTVNRQWAAFFGQGLVRTQDDFGVQGESPSHPKLLDWLAVGFMEDGWSLKRLHKRLVMSQVYQRSSRVNPEHSIRDPDNRLLARATRVRLEAEILRDYLLAGSGLLSAKMYGAPVRPPQPAGITELAYGRPKWQASAGEDRYRRSVYTHLKRTAPFAMFTTFDAPSGEACIARRESSNSALQALTLLNDLMFMEMSEALGKEVEASDGDKAAKIAKTFRRILTRPPAPEELDLLAAFINKGHSWAALARAIMNSDEAVTRN